jgi:RimJ/RimL family protein N-acetyltransferase
MDANPNPIVRGEKVWLRAFEREDIEPALRGTTDRDIADLVGFSIPFGKAMSERWYEEEVLKQYGERAYFFTICRLGSRELIGQCSFHNMQTGFRAEIGIWLLPEHCDHGFGTDAMNALLDFGFGNLGLRRIALHVSPWNARAIRSYEKAGFRHEGVMRSFRLRRGEPVDDAVMSILRDEWAALERPRSWDLPRVEVP